MPAAASRCWTVSVSDSGWLGFTSLVLTNSQLYVSAGPPDDPVWWFCLSTDTAAGYLVFWLLVSIFSNPNPKSSLLSSLFTPPLSSISPFKHYYEKTNKQKKKQWCCQLWGEHRHCGLWLCWCLCLWVQKKKTVNLFSERIQTNVSSGKA